jgi:hypothetical protein
MHACAQLCVGGDSVIGFAHAKGIAQLENSL